jgi:hypothetical protein
MFSLIIGLLSASLLTALRISLFAKRPHRKRTVDAYSLTVDKFHSMYGLDRKRMAKSEQRLSMLQSRKLMAQLPPTPGKEKTSPTLYCPTCAREVDDPLTCGDCSSVICRVCGTPLEVPEDLGIG